MVSKVETPGIAREPEQTNRGSRNFYYSRRYSNKYLKSLAPRAAVLIKCWHNFRRIITQQKPSTSMIDLAWCTYLIFYIGRFSLFIYYLRRERKKLIRFPYSLLHWMAQPGTKFMNLISHSYKNPSSPRALIRTFYLSQIAF